MKVTLKQIAAETGLSLSTVSRVVTGKGYVSEEARRLTEEAVHRLEYAKRDPRAMITSGREDLVMLLIGGIRSSLASETIELLCRELRSKQKRPFIAVTDFDPEAERSYLQFAADNHFFGIIAMTLTETPETLALLQHLSCPITMIDKYLPSVEMDYLRPDYYRMGFDSAEYLLKKGHRKIAFIGGRASSPITQDKKMGFEDCLNAFGCEIRPEWIIHADRLIYENGEKIVDLLLGLSELPTAIVSSNDISVSIVNELIAHGVRVPEDISLFTCEDSSMARFCQVPLTAMSIDMERIAIDAVRLLIRRQRHPRFPRNLLIYNPHLIERDSVSQLVET